MSRKPNLRQDQRNLRNSLQIKRPNISMNLLNDDRKHLDKRILNKLNCSATCGINSRANTDGDLSAGVTALLKNCVRQQLEIKRPVDLKLFAKRQTGSLYTGFEPINGKHRLTHIDRSGDRKKSAYEEILQGDRIKRFHTEKVSLNPSDKNIIKKRKLSFGKDNNQQGRSSELKKHSNVTQQRKRSVKSIDKNHDQMIYNRAVDLLSQNKIKQAIRDFQLLIDQGSSFKSNSYLWLSICYKKWSKIEQAIDILNRTLIEYPKHYEAYVYRSKLLTKSKKFDRAKKDANVAISLDPDKPLAYMVKADCLRANNEFKEAEKAYDLAIGCEKVDPSMIYLKKIQMEIEQIQYGQASKDIEKLLQLQPSNSETLSYKGIVQKQQGLLVEAALTFEQSLKHNNSRKGVSRALYELVKLKMQQRDFYEAYYALSRSQHLDVDTSLLENFRLFNEAAILLMKRKFQQAIKVFNQLEVRRQTFDNFLRPLFRQFKAYGYFCTGKHKEAVNEYKRLDYQMKDDISTFNQYLCEGIIEAEQCRYSNAIEYFKKAKEVFPNKVQPYIYIAVTFVRQANDAIKVQESPEAEKRRQTAVIRAMDELNSGNLINDGNSNLLYHRSILSYYFKDFKGGLDDINRCIQKAEDNIPKYFYMRGLGHACSKDLIKSINEFSICTSLDKNYAPAYVQRAKCLFLLGDTDKAFMDLHSYMELESKDMGIHKWIGDLLYESKSYNDALKTYCEMEDTYQTQQIVLMRIKCRVRLGMLEEARTDFNWLAKANKKFARSNRVDMSALSLLSGLMDRQPASRIGSSVKKLNEGMDQDIKGEVFRLIDCMMLIGIAAAHLGRYADASSSFILVKQLFEINSKSNKCEIKSEMSEQHLDLSLKKINFNIFIMKIAEKQFDQAIQFAKTQLMSLLDSSERETFYILLNSYEMKEQSQRSIILSKKNEIASKFELMEFQIGSVVLKTKLMQGIFHEVCNELYPYREAIGMIGLITPLYVENKPEAPWIRRNNYGVVFTENMLKNESIKLQTTELEKSEANNRVIQSYRSEEDRKDDIRYFKQKMKLDDQIQQKLKRMLQKAPAT